MKFAKIQKIKKTKNNKLKKIQIKTQKIIIGIIIIVKMQIFKKNLCLIIKIIVNQKIKINMNFN